MDIKKKVTRIKIDDDGKWITTLNSILDDIIFLYTYKDDAEVINWLMHFQISSQKQEYPLHIILLTDFAESIYSLGKYLPFLITLEKYEECQKINECFDLFAAEKIKQAEFAEIEKEISLDEFAEFLYMQKKTILDDLLNEK